ncbi:dynein light chain Tctex-type 5-like [Hemicordylus capensis]|uniref:dynein light chain Tctex-type 5-like n=1 Tax=Hemicordylus capensis TaxID=884348 RepID=UPI0023032ACA|nr:dynein light chain Tctex-type 5-like [Hemicordylus capensis]
MNSEKQSKLKASKENASRETGGKNVTFKAAEKERAISKSKPSPGLIAGESSPSKLRSAKELANVLEGKHSVQAAVSLSSLLTAQRFAKEFKIRTSTKSKARCQAYHCMSTTTENEQIPDSSAKPQEKFSCAQAEKLIEEYLSAKLADVTYEPVKCGSLIKALSDEIRHMFKKFIPPRYKLIINLVIGSRNKEDTTDIVVTSQCLWDPHSDNFASSQYINQTLFCVVLVHAVYFE